MKKTSIAIIILIVLALMALGACSYIISQKDYLFWQNTASVQQGQETEQITPEEQMLQIEKDYPEIVRGVINFFDTPEAYKATITTSRGKEYILWPPQPAPIYSVFGAEEGQEVEVQGKLNSQGGLEWGMIKPIK